MQGAGEQVGQGAARISVIIPHFNQAALLDRCLSALGPQVQAAGAEVIVVDNGSDRMPDAVIARHPGVRLAQETTPGPGPARNLGVGLATAPILAFIDADCVPAPDWLSVIAARFDRDPATQVIGGDVCILHGDPAHPTAIEAYEAEFGYRMEHYIRRQNFTGTGNLAMRRTAFDRVGGFAGLGVAEDRDWGQRAHALGIETRWEPAMRAFHPARETFAELARKWDRHTAHDFENHLTRPMGRLRWLIRTGAMVLSPVAAIPRIFLSKRITGGLRGRLLALAVLTRIRLYRARLMAPLILAPDASRLSARWRKG